MPKFRKKDNEQLTTPGLQISIGEIYNNDNDNLSYSEQMKLYQDMRNGDPIISGLLEFLKLPILQTNYRLDYDETNQISRQTAKYLEETYQRINFQDFKYHNLLAIENGCQIFEYVWEYTNWNGLSTQLLTKMSPIQAYTIQEFKFSDYQELLSLKVRKYGASGNSELVDIDENKLYIHTHNKEYGNILGRSILRPIRKYWTYKQSLIDAGTRLANRGGIPFIKHAPGDANRNQAEIIGRSFGNQRQAYIRAEKDKMEIEMLPLQSQDQIIPLLTYLDSQTFYGTLSQFMMSGIGQNGSRAATSEHKTSYELMANYIMMELENNLKYWNEKIIKHSPFAFMPQELIPVLKFDSISSIDVQKVVPNLVQLYSNNIVTKTKDDEDFIRNIVGLPEIEDYEIVEDVGQDYSSLEYNGNILEFESAKQHFETTKEKVEKLLSTWNSKVIDDMKQQYEKSGNAIPKYKIELVDALSELYNNGYKQGQRDVKKEISKLKKSKEFQDDIIEKKGIDKKLMRRIDRYYNDIEFIFFDAIESKDDIKQLDGILENPDDMTKQKKRDLINIVQSSYIEGRNQQMKQEPIKKWVYNAIFDNKICEKCKPYDNKELTIDEIKANGLQLSYPTNTKCLGGFNCRCLLVPSEVE